MIDPNCGWAHANFLIGPLCACSSVPVIKMRGEDVLVSRGKGRGRTVRLGNPLPWRAIGRGGLLKYLHNTKHMCLEAGLPAEALP